MAKADRRLFRPIDLVFPILPSVVSMGLCVYASFLSEGPGRWISIATGIAFLSLGTLGYYWARYAYTHADYITEHGVYVVLGKINRPSKQEVENYTNKCIDFWTTKSLQKQDDPVVIEREKVLEAIKNVRCFFYDKKIVGWAYKMIRGIQTKIKFAGVAYNNVQIVVSYWPDVPQHGVPGIFRHEMSHVILGLNGYPAGENFGDGHHRIFSRVGLGA